MKMNYVKHVNFGESPEERKMNPVPFKPFNNIKSKGPCPTCDGSGQDPEKAGKCEDCGGTGWIEVYPESIGGI